VLFLSQYLELTLSFCGATSFPPSPQGVKELSPL